MPYVRQPEAMPPGTPQFFATAMIRAGSATGLLVKSHEGRPTKVEGNPHHPASFGATDIFAQAAVLGLYDPDRSQSIIYRGQPRGWTAAQLAVRKALEPIRKNNGRGLRILTETVGSPTLADQIVGGRKGSVLQEFPEVRWYQVEPAASDARWEGARMVFGEAVDTIYDFSAADVVVALDADFLSHPAAGLRYTRDFMNRRSAPLRADGNLTTSAHPSGTNRLYAAECMPSIMGAVADHRLPMHAGRIQALARCWPLKWGFPTCHPRGNLRRVNAIGFRQPRRIYSNIAAPAS